MSSGKPMRAKRTLDRVVRLAVAKARREASQWDRLAQKRRTAIDMSDADPIASFQQGVACGIRIQCNHVLFYLRTVASADTSQPNIRGESLPPQGETMSNPKAGSGVAIDSTQLLGCTIGIEHDHLCFRNRNGWLLWSGKIADQPSSGWDWDTINAESAQEQASLQPNVAGESQTPRGGTNA